MVSSLLFGITSEGNKSGIFSHMVPLGCSL